MNRGAPYAWGESGALNLFPWLSQLLCSQRMSAAIKDCDNGKEMRERKVCGEGFCDPLGMDSEGKGRLQQIFCYRAGNETGVGVWTEEVETERKICGQPSCSAQLACPETCWSWGLGQSNEERKQG